MLECTFLLRDVRGALSMALLLFLSSSHVSLRPSHVSLHILASLEPTSHSTSLPLPLPSHHSRWRKRQRISLKRVDHICLHRAHSALLGAVFLPLSNDWVSSMHDSPSCTPLRQITFNSVTRAALTVQIFSSTLWVQRTLVSQALNKQPFTALVRFPSLTFSPF